MRPRSIPEGTRIGAYRIVSELGRGGMGAVFKAVDETRGDFVALKMILAESAGDAEIVKRFRREARAVQAVQSPNVVALRDVIEQDGASFIALEFCEGGTLASRTKREPLPWADAARLGAQIARGLAAIHAAGMVHRDMKPENVLIGADGTAKVADLGLVRGGAAAAGSLGGLTKTGEMLGTPRYMAPEQIDQSKHVDARADLYSLGATLFAVLTGRPPFEESGIALLNAQMLTPAPSARELVPDLPRSFDALLFALLEKEPGNRPETAEQVATMLDAIARGEKIASPRRGRVVAIAVTFIVLAVGGVAVVLAMNAKPSSDDARPATTATPATGQSVARSPTPRSPTAWFDELAPGERPPKLPLGVHKGSIPGEYVNEKDGSILVFVAGGVSRMGTALDVQTQSEEKPQHEVELSPYFIGKLEVTNAQFAEFVKATGYETDAEKNGRAIVEEEANGADWGVPVAGASWKTPQGPKSTPPPDWPSHPVVQVSWRDARAYCTWAGLRLPTEAEWEKAATWDAKAREARRYPWGKDELDAKSKKYANVGDKSVRAISFPPQLPDYDDGFARTAPVGSFPDGASPVGALDMVGNVREWCEDISDGDFYARSPRRDPRNVSDEPEDVTVRIVRGGSFLADRGSLWPRRRDQCAATGSIDDLGFRVARNAR